jgi:hypothetical protein
MEVSCAGLSCWNGLVEAGTEVKVLDIITKHLAWPARLEKENKSFATDKSIGASKTPGQRDPSSTRSQFLNLCQSRMPPPGVTLPIQLASSQPTSD